MFLRLLPLELTAPLLALDYIHALRSDYYHNDINLLSHMSDMLGAIHGPHMLCSMLACFLQSMLAQVPRVNETLSDLQAHLFCE